MTESEFKARTQAFAAAAIRFVDRLPRSRGCDVAAGQFLKCATSVGANYRSACRGRSDAEMLAKLGIVVEEGDEALYWLELLSISGICKPDQIEDLYDEANQIVAMCVARKFARIGS